jgi:hypothetical protein
MAKRDIGSLNVKLTASADEFKADMKRAEATVEQFKKKVTVDGGFAGWIKSAKLQAGEASTLGQSLKMLVGTGAVAAVAMLGEKLAHATTRMVELKNEFNAGTISARAMAAAIIETIPVLGSAYTVTSNIRELITGEEAAILRTIKANEKKAAGIEAIHARYLEVKKIVDEAAATARRTGNEAELLLTPPGLPTELVKIRQELSGKQDSEARKKRQTDISADQARMNEINRKISKARDDLEFYDGNVARRADASKRLMEAEGEAKIVGAHLEALQSANLGESIGNYYIAGLKAVKAFGDEVVRAGQEEQRLMDAAREVAEAHLEALKLAEKENELRNAEELTRREDEAAAEWSRKMAEQGGPQAWWGPQQQLQRQIAEIQKQVDEGTMTLDDAKLNAMKAGADFAAAMRGQEIGAEVRRGAFRVPKSVEDDRFAKALKEAQNQTGQQRKTNDLLDDILKKTAIVVRI